MANDRHVIKNEYDRFVHNLYRFVASAVFAAGTKDIFLCAGGRIEWNKTGSLIYEPDEMLMFFHELGHYLYNSHLLVGMENQQIRTEPVCDEDHYTYAKFAPTCFPDPYAGMDVR